MDHPLYNGDYIAQTKNELLYFKAELDNSIKKKAEGMELIIKRKSSDFTWPRYNFAYVQKYVDEKLASNNPKIYLVDLDEVMKLVNLCLLKYSKLVNKSVRDLNDILLVDFSFDEERPTVLINQILFKTEIKFCLHLKEYYLKKRKLLNFEIPSLANDAELEAQIILDQEILFDILSGTLEAISDNNLIFLRDYILNCKYGKPVEDIIPVMALTISQTKLIQMITKVRKELNLEPSSRNYLADLFSMIPKTYIKQKPQKYNRDSIYKKM